MPDYDDRPDDRDDRNRNLDDDRPRKKKSAWPMILIILGVIGVICVGGCGYGIYWYVNAVMGIIKAPEELLTKVKSGDFQGAYKMTAPSYQTRYTQEQFTAAMKGAKLDQNTGITGTPSNAPAGNTISLGVSVGVPGGTTSVTFKLAQQGSGLTFLIDDITGPDIKYGDTK